MGIIGNKGKDYALNILKTILYNKVTTEFDYIEGREELVFKEEGQLKFYEFILEYYRKYDVIPSLKYCKEFFSAEKDNPAKMVYNQIRQKSVEKIKDNIRATIDLQLRTSLYVVSKNIAKEFQADLKLGNPSELESTVDKLQEDLIFIKNNLAEKKSVEGLLHEKTNAKDKYLSKYKKRKLNDGYYIAKFGVDLLDNTIGGIHSVDFISIVGYVKQFKSTLARQIGYNFLTQVKNVVFITLEMSYDDIENHFYTLHANNTKRFGFDKPKITNKAVKEATLDGEAEEYFLDTVIPDFTEAEDLGSLYIKQPEGNYTLDHLKSDLNKIHKNIMPIDLVIIDSPLQMYPYLGSRRSREEMNTMIADIRNLSLTFNGGEGLPIIATFQINRSGYDEMLRGKRNLYDLTAIAEYNEVERSSTHVISTAQTEDMRESNEVQLQHLASRETELFETKKVMIDPQTGVYFNTDNKFDEEDVDSIIDEIDI